MLIKPEYVFIHHSLTKDSGSVSWPAIRNYHVNKLGWREIGYHYGIEMINNQNPQTSYYEILVGRFEGETGAHTKGYNSNSIGICLVGNHDDVPISPAKWKLTLQLVMNICLRYKIPSKNVLAHREVASYKSCPGNLFDIEKFRNNLNELI